MADAGERAVTTPLIEPEITWEHAWQERERAAERRAVALERGTQEREGRPGAGVGRTGDVGVVRKEPSGQPLSFEAERVLGELARHYLPRHTALTPGNRVSLLRDGVEAFPAMLEAIRGARESIRLETYMFIDDVVGQMVARALIEAAGRGVKVTVLYDLIGSWRTGRAFFGQMRAGGVQVRPFRPFRLALGMQLIRRDHRKLLIVDGTVAFTGGLNIAAHWAPPGIGDGWRDDVVELRGPIVAQLERRFSATWWMTVRQRLAERRKARRPARVRQREGEVAVTVLSSRRAIHRAYLRAIRRSRERIFIAAGYFVPDRRMLHALRDAARRGVEVTLLLTERSDHRMVRYASRCFYERLLRWGVKIHLWKQSVLHSKTAVVDGTWATIGSFNLERTSLRLNHEMNVVLVDPTLGQLLEASVRRDCLDCRGLDLETWAKRPFLERLLERLSYAFRKIL